MKLDDSLSSILSGLTNKLNGRQALIIIIIIIVALIGLRVTSMIEERGYRDYIQESFEGINENMESSAKMMNEIAVNMMLIRTGDLNNLSYFTAQEILKSVLTAQRCAVIGELHKLITNYNIYDKDEQKFIRSFMLEYIETQRKQVKRKLAKLSYNNVTLDNIVDETTPTEKEMNVLFGILFNESYKSDQTALRMQLVKYMYLLYDKKYEKSIANLSKLNNN